MAASAELETKVAKVIVDRLAKGPVEADSEGGLYDRFKERESDGALSGGVRCSKTQFASILSGLVQRGRVRRHRAPIEGVSQPMPPIVLTLA